MPLPRNGNVQPVEGVSGGIPIPVTPVSAPDNKTSVNFKIVTIVDHTQAYQGPNVAIPAGYSVVAALRINQDGSPVGYIASAQADVADASKRKNFVKGFPFAAGLQNMNELWFGADTDGAIWELYAEAV